MPRAVTERVVPAGKYKLSLDERGRVVCSDRNGERVPLGRCFQIGVGDAADEIKVAIKKSCELGPDFQEKIKARIKAGGTTVWAVTEDESVFNEDSTIRRKRKS